MKIITFAFLLLQSTDSGEKLRISIDCSPARRVRVKQNNFNMCQVKMLLRTARIHPEQQTGNDFQEGFCFT